ncbi:MAG: fumarate hydratase [bacterium]
MRGLPDIEKSLLELIRRTSTDLPADVEAAIRRALVRERKGSRAAWALGSILENIALARQKDQPICQDTGELVFSFNIPIGFDVNALMAETRSAVSIATRRGYLRQNTLDSVTGVPYETNVAYGMPVFQFHHGARRVIDVSLLMKGGGSENVGCQYSLPDESLDADRDLEGVRRCVLDAIQKAQGNGCGPGVVGVCIGGDRASGYEHSREQFFRKLDDKSPVRALAKLESKILREANRLGIGPMGMGGAVTLLGAKVGALGRVPASFFVSVSFMCWAFRRRRVALGSDGKIGRWLFR